MGRENFSKAAFSARTTMRAATSAPVFVHTHDINTGKVKAGVDTSLNPRGITRECRDSTAHPITIPIGVVFDTTGSMSGVPEILEARLPKLMGNFLDDKASGKHYLGDGYPAICVGAIDDYIAQTNGYRSLDPTNCGALQVGQFETGIEIDNDLEKIWLTKNGGGTYEESYELALYFFARKTVHDHWEKRGKKGYLFLIGDESPYEFVNKTQIENVIGDSVQGDIETKSIIKELQKRYHVFFIIPNMTNHYHSSTLFENWLELLGQQHVLKLDDPNKICEMIVGAVALTEAHVGIDDLIKDDVLTSGMSSALVPLSKGAGIAKVSADRLPALSCSGGAVERF